MRKTLSSDMDDASLAVLAAKGSEEAFSALSHRFAPISRKIVARYSSVAGLDTEDLLQEGLLGLLAAVHGYDAAHGDFSALAVTCIRNRVVSAVRKHLPIADVSLPDVPELLLSEPEGQADPASLLIEQEEAKRIYRILREKLTAVEYGVLTAYLSGRSYKEIAEEMCISAKAVDNALQRARQKLSKDRLQVLNNGNDGR